MNLSNYATVEAKIKEVIEEILTANRTTDKDF